MAENHVRLHVWLHIFVLRLLGGAERGEVLGIGVVGGLVLLELECLRQEQFRHVSVASKLFLLSVLLKLAAVSVGALKCHGGERR